MNKFKFRLRLCILLPLLFCLQGCISLVQQEQKICEAYLVYEEGLLRPGGGSYRVYRLNPEEMLELKRINELQESCEIDIFAGTHDRWHKPTWHFVSVTEPRGQIVMLSEVSFVKGVNLRYLPPPVAEHFKALVQQVSQREGELVTAAQSNIWSDLVKSEYSEDFWLQMRKVMSLGATVHLHMWKQNQGAEVALTESEVNALDDLLCRMVPAAPRVCDEDTYSVGGEYFRIRVEENQRAQEFLLPVRSVSLKEDGGDYSLRASSYKKWLNLLEAIRKRAVWKPIHYKA